MARRVRVDALVKPAKHFKVSKGVSIALCPYCSTYFRDSELDQHIRDIHLTQASQLRSTSSPEKLHKRSAPKVAKTIRLRDIEELDASRDYYRFRDNGQFGSYPLIDDYGDESDP